MVDFALYVKQGGNCPEGPGQLEVMRQAVNSHLLSVIRSKPVQGANEVQFLAVTQQHSLNVRS
jgi:hypothetical protein